MWQIDTFHAESILSYCRASAEKCKAGDGK